MHIRWNDNHIQLERYTHVNVAAYCWICGIYSLNGNDNARPDATHLHEMNLEARKHFWSYKLYSVKKIAVLSSHCKPYVIGLQKITKLVFIFWARNLRIPKWKLCVQTPIIHHKSKEKSAKKIENNRSIGKICSEICSRIFSKSLHVGVYLILRCKLSFQVFE